MISTLDRLIIRFPRDLKESPNKYWGIPGQDFIVSNLLATAGLEPMDAHRYAKAQNKIEDLIARGFLIVPVDHGLITHSEASSLRSWGILTPTIASLDTLNPTGSYNALIEVVKTLNTDSESKTALLQKLSYSRDLFQNEAWQKKKQVAAPVSPNNGSQ
jgi:hypothetical protein